MLSSPSGNVTSYGEPSLTFDFELRFGVTEWEGWAKPGVTAQVEPLGVAGDPATVCNELTASSDLRNSYLTVLLASAGDAKATAVPSSLTELTTEISTTLKSESIADPRGLLALAKHPLRVTSADQCSEPLWEIFLKQVIECTPRSWKEGVASGLVRVRNTKEPPESRKERLVETIQGFANSHPDSPPLLRASIATREPADPLRIADEDRLLAQPYAVVEDFTGAAEEAAKRKDSDRSNLIVRRGLIRFPDSAPFLRAVIATCNDDVLERIAEDDQLLALKDAVAQDFTNAAYAGARRKDAARVKHLLQQVEERFPDDESLARIAGGSFIIRDDRPAAPAAFERALASLKPGEESGTGPGDRPMADRKKVHNGCHLQGTDRHGPGRWRNLLTGPILR